MDTVENIEATQQNTINLPCPENDIKFSLTTLFY